MAKVKNKRNLGLSDKVHNKRKSEAHKKQLNPFEIHINREKIQVLGKKSKHDRGLPGVSRAKAIQKRKETIGTELKLVNKTNAFIDRRIGEKNSQLSSEDRLIARFAAERVRQHTKKNIYNLADDEILTHRGQTLEDIEKFDDPRSSDEEDDDGRKAFGGLDDEFVSEGHFGGGILSRTESKDGAKSHKDLIEQLIAESKKRKAEKQKEKEQTLDMTEKLDTDWKDLQPVVFKRPRLEEKAVEEKSDIIDNLLSKVDKKAEDYDKTMRELRFEKRGTPSDSLKNKEQLEKEERSRIDELEKQRDMRMSVPVTTTVTTTKHRSADDLDDNFELDDGPDYMLSYDKDGKPNIPEHIVKQHSGFPSSKKFDDGYCDTSSSDDDSEEEDDENDNEEDNSNKDESEEESSNNNSDSQKVDIAVKDILIKKIKPCDDNIEEDHDKRVENQMRHKIIKGSINKSQIKEPSNSGDKEENNEKNGKNQYKGKVKNTINKSPIEILNNRSKLDKKTKVDESSYFDNIENKSILIDNEEINNESGDDKNECSSHNDETSNDNEQIKTSIKDKLDESSDCDSENDKQDSEEEVQPFKNIENKSISIDNEEINNESGEDKSDDDENSNDNEQIKTLRKDKQNKYNFNDYKDIQESDEESECSDLSEDDSDGKIISYFEFENKEDNLQELLEGKTPKEQSKVLEELIKKYDPRLSKDNKDNLTRLYAHLLQYLNDTFINKKTAKQIKNAFKIFEILAPYFYQLAHKNKFMTKKYLMDVITEKRNKYLKKRKLVPDLDTLIFFKLVSLLYPTSDFKHPVVTPCFVFMSEILHQCNFDNAYSISRGLFIATLLLEYTVLSKKLIPAKINFLRGVIYLCANISILNPVTLVPPFKLRKNDKYLNLENDCSKMDVKSKMLAEDFVLKEVNDSFKIRCLTTCVLILKETFDYFNDIEAQECLFKPHIDLLDKVDIEWYPKDIAFKIIDTVRYMKEMLEVKTFKPLTEERKKPKALRLYEPDVQEVFTDSKSSKCKTKAERDKLKHKLKREMKGALREIRRDKSYIASVKIRQKIHSDNIRKDKVKQIYKDASIQQGELNKLKRTK